ncbi:hypothetical protein CFC21_067068, partial [Triticum aestivum]
GGRRRRPGPAPVAGRGRRPGRPRDPSVLPLAPRRRRRRWLRRLHAPEGRGAPGRHRHVRLPRRRQGLHRGRPGLHLRLGPQPPQAPQIQPNPRRHLLRPPHQAHGRLAARDRQPIRRHPIRRSLAGGDFFSGCWATAGVVLDKGTKRVSAQGKDYSIWKMGALDDSEVSVFLFGDAHTHYSGGAVGDVFALFNGNVRMDKGGQGFSVSVGSVGQMMKMGVSADFSICKGTRKDGMACTMVTNKRKGPYCKYHSSSTSSQKYSTGRVELKGGNFQFASKLRSNGIYMVKPPSERSDPRNPSRPLKVMSVDGLKRALSNADKVTTKNNSQGIRFLSHVTGGTEPNLVSNSTSTVVQKPMSTWSTLSEKLSSGRRPASSGAKVGAPKLGSQKQEQEAKRRKVNNPSGNTIELDLGSSDDDEINIVLRR